MPCGFDAKRADHSTLCDNYWQKLKRWPKQAQGPELSVVDLFSGCGGMTLGLWEAARLANRQLRVRLAVDFNVHAASIYKENFSFLCDDFITADITDHFSATVGTDLSDEERRLKAAVGRLDMLVGGPPCQGHSDLNNSSRRQDPRNSLYFRMVRAADVLCPQVILIENVPAVQHDRGHVVARAENALEKMKYHVSSAVIDIKTLGMAQSRKRHLLLATKEKTPTIKVMLDSLSTAPAALKTVIGDLPERLNESVYDTPSRPNSENQSRIDHLFEKNIYNLPNELRPRCHSSKPHSYVSMYGRLSWGIPSQTITSGFGSMGQGRFVHPEFRRMITPHEAARIQGFPDFFSFLKLERRTLLQEIIGNAVPPKLTASVMNCLLARNIFNYEAIPPKLGE